MVSGQLSLSVVFKNRRQTLARNKQLASSILCLCRPSPLKGLELCLAPLLPPSLPDCGQSVLSVLLQSSACFSMVAFLGRDAPELV